MSPRTGRPLKGSERKTISLQLRLSPETAAELRECAETLGISRTEVIEQGIKAIHQKAVKQK